MCRVCVYTGLLWMAKLCDGMYKLNWEQCQKSQTKDFYDKETQAKDSLVCPVRCPLLALIWIL